MQWQGESVRKVTGGRRRPAAMKRRAEIGACTGRHPYRRGPARGLSARSAGMTSITCPPGKLRQRHQPQDRRDQKSKDRDRGEEHGKPELRAPEPAHQGCSHQDRDRQRPHHEPPGSGRHHQRTVTRITHIIQHFFSHFRDFLPLRNPFIKKPCQQSFFFQSR